MSIFKQIPKRRGRIHASEIGRVFSDRVQQAGIFCDDGICPGLVVAAKDAEVVRQMHDLFPKSNCYVVWKDYMNNHPVFRILSSHYDPEYVLKHLDMKYRFAVVDASGSDVGSIEVEPYIGFLLDDNGSKEGEL